MKEATEPDQSHQEKKTPATPHRAGARRQGPSIPVAAILVGIALLTAIGSLYVYMAGYRARIQRDIARAEYQIQVLMSETTAMQRQIAEEESYMRLHSKVHEWGMQELRPGDCNYFRVPPDESLARGKVTPAHADAPGVPRIGERSSP